MSSPIDYKKFSVAQLLATRTSIDEAIMALSGGASGMPSAATAGGKKKGPKVKRQGGASAWGDWTKKVMTDYDAEIKAYKEAAETKAGAHLKWISANMGKTSQEWLSFKANWDATHPKPVKGAKSESETSEGEAEEGEASEGEVAVATPAAAEKVAKKRGPKKLADMTPEERAKHDAGVAERKTKKNAGAAALEAAAKAAAPILPILQATPLMVGGGSSSAAVATPVPVPEEDEDAIELKIFLVDGQKYMRPWSSSANTWATNDLWYTNKKGEKAAYWGELMEDGSVNADAEEPKFN